jgi:hypothetical protein
MIHAGVSFIGNVGLAAILIANEVEMENHFYPYGACCPYPKRTWWKIEYLVVPYPAINELVEK